MITSDDVFIALSNSGQTEELTIVPLVKRQGARLIAFTGNAASALARQPTSTSMPAPGARPARSTWRRPPAPPRRWRWATPWRWRCWMRVASAVPTSPARIRAARSVGQLLTLVSDVMRTGEDVPAVPLDSDFAAALLEITRKRMGMVAIVDDNRHVQGIFTDGDLRPCSLAAPGRCDPAPSRSAMS